MTKLLARIRPRVFRISLTIVIVGAILLALGYSYGYYMHVKGNQYRDEGMALYEAQSYDKALPLLVRSAENGNTLAQMTASEMYAEGMGTQKDLEKSLYWLDRAAARHPVAQYNLARIYEDGNPLIHPDIEKAFELYDKAAKLGHKQANEKAFMMAVAGEGIDRNKIDEKVYALKANAHGSTKIHYDLGMYFLVSPDSKSPPRKSIELIRMAADQGDADAQAMMGLLYQQGQYVIQDDKQARVWYHKAAEQGNAKAKHQLAALNMTPAQITQQRQAQKMLEKEEYGQAFPITRQLAEAGDVLSQRNLGVMYLYGLGTPKSEDKAVIWFNKAMSNGSVNAKYFLAMLHETGEGVEKDTLKAYRLCRDAARDGDANGQYMLATFYLDGKGTNKNKDEAQKWLEKASLQQHDKARILQASLIGMGDKQTKPMRVADYFKGNRYERYFGPVSFSYAGMQQRPVFNITEIFIKAEKGDADAQYQLGKIYDRGELAEPDAEKAKYWYEKAAAQNNPHAVMRLEAMKPEKVGATTQEKG